MPFIEDQAAGDGRTHSDREATSNPTGQGELIIRPEDQDFMSDNPTLSPDYRLAREASRGSSASPATTTSASRNSATFSGGTSAVGPDHSRTTSTSGRPTEPGGSVSGSQSTSRGQ